MEGVSQQEQPKLPMIFFADASSDPRTVMIVLPDASATVKAMFGPILGPTVANITKVPLIPLKLQQLILFNSILLKPWILSSSQHEVRIDNQQSPKRKKIDMVVV